MCIRDSPVGVRSCYDDGKRCAETLFMDYRRMNGVVVRIIRIFNTYGPRMNPNDGIVVSNFIVQALKGEDITIYGTGKQTRSFQYVDDLVEGMAVSYTHLSAQEAPSWLSFSMASRSGIGAYWLSW